MKKMIQKKDHSQYFLTAALIFAAVVTIILLTGFSIWTVMILLLTFVIAAGTILVYKKRDKFDVHFSDCLIFAIPVAVSFFMFNQSDLFITATHGLLFDELLFKGEALHFYEYGGVSIDWEANYTMLIYFMFAIWNLPYYLTTNARGINNWSGLIENNENMMPYSMLMWNKLLILIFYLATAFVVYKICRELKLSKTSSKWTSFGFLCSAPVLFLSFIYAQYSIFSTFFLIQGTFMLCKNRKILSSLWIALSVLCKANTLIFALPLLLLKEKNVVKILLNVIVMIAPMFILGLIFNFGDGFVKASFYNFMASVLADLLQPLFVVSFLGLLVFSYLKKIKNIHEENIWMIYLGFLANTVFIAFSHYNMTLLTSLCPFIVIMLNFAKQKNITQVVLIVTYCAIAYLAILHVPYRYFEQTFLTDYIVNYNAWGTELTYLFTLNGLIPEIIYTYILQTGVIILGFLTKPHIVWGNAKTESVTVGRTFAMTNLLIVCIMIVLLLLWLLI